jgi:hypothetical protein
MRDSGPAVVNLRTEYLRDPIGIHARRPRLSREVGSPRRGAVQRAHRIVAGSAPDAADRWDSGWVESRDTHGIRYSGAPVPDRSLDHAEGSYRAITGEIRSRWEWTDAGYRLEVTIPANVDARVVLPGAGEVTEGGVPVASADGIRSVEQKGDATIVTTGAGAYTFDVTGISGPATP